MDKAIHLDADEVAHFGVNPNQFHSLPFAQQRDIAAQILHANGDPRAWQLEANSPVLTRFIIDTQITP